MLIFRQYNISPIKPIGVILLAIGLAICSLVYTKLPLNNDISILAAETPNKPTNLDLDSADDTGLSNKDNITGITDNLTVTGCADASTTITYYDNGTEISTTTTGNTTCSGGGYAFTKDINLSEDNVHAITVTATNESNMVSATSARLNIMIDTIAPKVTSSSSQYYSDQSLSSTFTGTIGVNTDIYTRIEFDDGMARKNDSQDQDRPIISYTVDGVATKYNMIASSSDLTSGSCHATGVGACIDVYVCLYTVAEADAGEFSFKVGDETEDRAGNTLTETYTHTDTLTLDATGPNPPTELNLDDAYDSGTHTIDNITNHTDIVITGCAEADSTITLYDSYNGSTTTIPNTASATGTVCTSGRVFSHDLTLTGEGDHLISAVAEDTIGNKSSTSTPLTVTFDTIGPTVSSFSAATTDLGKDATTSITITLSENSTDFTLADITKTGLGIVDAFAGTSQKDYTVVYTPPINNTGATATVQILAGKFEDIAGNSNSTSSLITFDFDTVAPATPGVSFTDTGTSSSDNITKNGTITVTTELGASWEYEIDDSGSWLSGIGNTYTATAEGTHTYAFRQKDAKLNLSPETSTTFELDTTQPTIIAFGADSNTLGADATTGITITFSEKVYGFEDYEIGMTGNGATGSFSGTDGDSSYSMIYTSPSVGASTTSFSIAASVATDLAGNLSTTTASFSITYDAVPPLNDPGRFTLNGNGDVIAGSILKSETASFSGTTDSNDITAGDYISIFNGTKPAICNLDNNTECRIDFLTNVPLGAKSWQFTLPANSLSKGNYTLTAKYNDKAGNTSAITSTFKLTVTEPRKRSGGGYSSSVSRSTIKPTTPTESVTPTSTESVIPTSTESVIPIPTESVTPTPIPLSITPTTATLDPSVAAIVRVLPPPQTPEEEKRRWLIINSLNDITKKIKAIEAIIAGTKSPQLLSTED